MLVNLCQCSEQRNSDQSREELGNWFVSLSTYREEQCLLLLIGNVWLRMLPKPIDSFEYHIRIKSSYCGGVAAYCQTPHVLCRKACRECAIHVVVTAADSCEYRIINTFYPFHWVIRAGGKNVGNLWESAGRERANRPPPQHSSQ